MTDLPVTRFANSEGSVSLHSLGKSRLLIVLTGRDVGAFGRAPFLELERRLAVDGPLELFFDLRLAKHASLDVSASWAVWLKLNAARLAHVGMLTQAPGISLSAKAVQRFSELGARAHIYADAVAFERAFRSVQQ